MSRWHVQGIERATGKETAVYVDAPSERDAVVAAAGDGMLVTKVTNIKTSKASSVRASAADVVRPPAGLPPTVAPGQIEVCANCGEKIGKLESPHVWQNNVVCARCFQRLAGPRASEPAAAGPAGHAPPDVVRTTDAVAGRVMLIILALLFAVIGIFALLSKLADR